ncbi:MULTISPECIES: helix-turn-helix transcriptional regulator [Bacillus]|uniref:helix-turn-helix domain-containing protein n=1 Tax=Bacillus TaxID=1386 RepID=UPI0028813013|nr:helix-turn-helix transcriptional regulator [Bacillus sp. AG4(2022)]MDT0161376.1 helix-turn-helix transcriptional regulator [Bacillus sp. AG4(2022)]
MEVGLSLRKIRIERGYSLGRLAKEANVSKSYISEIERGLHNNPSISFLKKISDSLNTSLDVLMRISVSEHKETLDKEWAQLINQAIDNGIKKEDLQDLRNNRVFKEE